MCVGVELARQSLESGNVFGTSSMNDVEVFSRDRLAAKHRSDSIYNDKLHPYIREAPKRLAKHPRRLHRLRLASQRVEAARGWQRIPVSTGHVSAEWP